MKHYEPKREPAKTTNLEEKSYIVCDQHVENQVIDENVKKTGTEIVVIEGKAWLKLAYFPEANANPTEFVLINYSK